MLKPDHQRDAGMMQYGQNSSTAEDGARLVGVRNKLSCGTGSVACLADWGLVVGGRVGVDPIEQIKSSNGPIRRSWRLELLSGWHPLPHAGPWRRRWWCEVGEMKEGVYKFSLGGNGPNTAGLSSQLAGCTAKKSLIRTKLNSETY